MLCALSSWAEECLVAQALYVPAVCVCVCVYVCVRAPAHLVVPSSWVAAACGWH